MEGIDNYSELAERMRPVILRRNALIESGDIEGLLSFSEADVQALSELPDRMLANCIFNALLAGDIELCEKIMVIRPDLEIGSFRLIGSYYRNARSDGNFNISIEVMSSKTLKGANSTSRLDRILSLTETLPFADGGQGFRQFLLDEDRIFDLVMALRPAGKDLKFLTKRKLSSEFMPGEDFKLPVLNDGLVSSPELLFALKAAQKRPQGAAYNNILCWAPASIVAKFPGDLRGFRPDNRMRIIKHSVDNGRVRYKTSDIGIDDLWAFGDKSKGELSLTDFDWSRGSFNGSTPNDMNKPFRIKGLSLSIAACDGEDIGDADKFALGHYASPAVKCGLAPEFQEGLVLCSTTTEFLSNFDISAPDFNELNRLMVGVEDFMPLGWISCLNAPDDTGNSRLAPLPLYGESFWDSHSTLIGIAKEYGLADAFIGRLNEGLVDFIVRDCTHDIIHTEILHMVNKLNIKSHHLRTNMVYLQHDQLGLIDELDVRFHDGMDVSITFPRDMSLAQKEVVLLSLLDRFEGGGKVAGTDINSSMTDILAIAVKNRTKLEAQDAEILPVFLGIQIKACDMNHLADSAVTDAQWRVIQKLRSREDVLSVVGKMPSSIRVDMVTDEFNI